MLSPKIRAARKRKSELEQIVRRSTAIKTFEQREKLGPNDSVACPAPPDGINASKAAQAVAVVFVAFVLYFIFDMYFGFGEYYAGATPSI